MLGVGRTDNKVHSIMNEDVLDDKQKRDATVEENNLDGHELEIMSSLPNSGEEYYYMLSKEKRKNVVPFSPMDIEYFELLDVEDKADFICMSRVQRDEHINYLRSAKSYEKKASNKKDETRMTRKEEKSIIGILINKLRDYVKRINKNDDGDRAGYLEKNSHTDIEKKYVGLKKVYIVTAVAVLCLVVMGSVLKGLGSDKKVKDDRINNYNSKNAITGTHLYSIPKDYSVLAADEKREKENREHKINPLNSDKKDEGKGINEVGDRVQKGNREKPYRREEGYGQYDSKLNKERELQKLKEEELLKAMASPIGFEIKRRSSGK